MRVAITGSRGFIGSAFQRLIISQAEDTVCEIVREDFVHKENLVTKLSLCDVVVHFAGESRSTDQIKLYENNIALVKSLIGALVCSGNSKCRVFFASTTHIKKETLYHKSKRDCAELLEKFNSAYGNPVTVWYIPNTFGALMRTDFNSVIPTFAMLAAKGKKPDMINDVNLPLITLPKLLVTLYDSLMENKDKKGYSTEVIKDEFVLSLPGLWNRLEFFKRSFQSGQLPKFTNVLDIELWNTFYYFAVEK